MLYHCFNSYLFYEARNLCSLSVESVLCFRFMICDLPLLLLRLCVSFRVVAGYGPPQAPEHWQTHAHSSPSLIHPQIQIHRYRYKAGRYNSQKRGATRRQQLLGLTMTRAWR